MTGEEKKNKKEGWKIGMEEASRKKKLVGWNDGKGEKGRTRATS